MPIQLQKLGLTPPRTGERVTESGVHVTQLRAQRILRASRSASGFLELEHSYVSSI